VEKMIHFRGLNGLRAIAAIAVVISHTTLDLDKFGLIATIFGSDSAGKPKGLLLASYGVSIFFALSGFLITYLLLQEKKSTQIINIKHFYIRRALRIWPLYYLYILLCFIVYYYFEVPYDKAVVPFYIFMLANIPMIMNNMLPFLGHFWSLGVEEQFYLFWPWLAKISTDKLLKISFFLVILLFGLKLFFWITNLTIPLVALSITRFHTMIIGCIGAIFYYNKVNLFLTNKYIQVLCWSIYFLIAVNLFVVPSLIANEIVAIVTVCVIYAQIERKNMIIDLDNKIFDFIGKISFGIYVYHPLILFLLAKSSFRFKESSITNYIIVYLIVLLLTILVAKLSYRFYEKRFILLKNSFAKIKSRA